MSLSDKEISAPLTDSSQPKYRKSDVKAFIKELKAKGEEYEWEGSEVIDELAGEKLI